MVRRLTEQGTGGSQRKDRCANTQITMLELAMKHLTGPVQEFLQYRARLR